jgi:hypothetical protein
MSLTTHGGLKAAVASWLNRGDMTSTIPDLISLAHAEIQARLRHWRMLNRATATLDAKYTAKPDDFLEADYIFLKTSPITEIEVVSPRTLILEEARLGYSSGKPKLLAFAEEIMVTPTPDQSYTMEMLYYQSLTELSSDGDYNWVLTHFPQLYLFGALKEAAPYLHEDERVQVWEAKFEKAMTLANKDGTSHDLSAGVKTLSGTNFI